MNKYFNAASKIYEEDITRMSNYLCVKDELSPILVNLPNYSLPPVLSPPKVIWWCWLQGEEAAPPIVTTCLKSIRYWFNEYEINIIHEHNLETYIKLPKCILRKYAAGNITRTHFSDIIRTFLLTKYGGIWLDATVLCTGIDKIEPLFQLPLFFFSHLYRHDYGILNSSWLISSVPNHPILLIVRDLLSVYWSKFDKLIDYFLFHFLVHIACAYKPDLYSKIPVYSNLPPHFLWYEIFNHFSEVRFKQLTEMTNIHKLSYKFPKDIIPDICFYRHIVESDGFIV